MWEKSIQAKYRPLSESAHSDSKHSLSSLHSELVGLGVIKTNGKDLIICEYLFVSPSNIGEPWWAPDHKAATWQAATKSQSAYGNIIGTILASDGACSQGENWQWF